MYSQRILLRKMAQVAASPQIPFQNSQRAEPAIQHVSWAKYVMQDKSTPNDYYHVLTFNRSSPGDGELIVGSEKYLPISFGHRQGYVKANDVDVLRR